MNIEQHWDGRPLPRERRVRFALLPRPEGLELRCAAALFSDRLPPGPPGPTPRLWEHEVVEFFFGGEGGYTEVELSPFGNHLVLRLAGYREILEEGLPLDYRAVLSSARGRRSWGGRARLPWSLLPPGPLRFNVCAIQPGPIYAQWSPARGEKPDFHDARCWRPATWVRPP